MKKNKNKTIKILLYIIVATAFIALMMLARQAAVAERHNHAVGGEVFAIVYIPVIVYGVYRNIKDTKQIRRRYK